MLKDILKKYEKSNLELFKLKLDSKDNLSQAIKSFMQDNKIALNDENFNAILLRIIDLNTNLFKGLCEKEKLDENEIAKKLYLITKDFWQKKQSDLLEELKPFLDEFYQALFILIHKIGLVLNEITPKWDEQIKQNNDFFKKLEKPFDFIEKHKLYYLDNEGKKATRMYALATNLDKSPKILPYAKYFKKEFKLISSYFDKFFSQITSENPYTKYLKALQKAMLSTELNLDAWQECEMLWMDVKEPIQIGHFLEYYEDAFTHSVAFELDVRINDDYDFASDEFVKNMSKSLEKAYFASEINCEGALNLSLTNLEKTQFYICKPLFFYGAQLNGLFSAQVVPNDEFVSTKYGKKIFAFLDHVYQTALAKPKTMLRQKVFSKDFNDFADSVLNDEKLWKKIYEITTIGHEGGHIFFIDNDTEAKLNISGEYKNIEEFKASAGGIYDFFNNDDAKYHKALLANIVSRSIGLMAYKDSQELTPYYCEGLIFLEILFKSEVLSLGNSELVNVNLNNFDKFKHELILVYTRLSKIYLNKSDANEFLREFAYKKDGYYISKNNKIAELEIKYKQLYKEFANVIIKEKP